MAGPLSVFSATVASGNSWSASGATIASSFGTPSNSGNNSTSYTYATGTTAVGGANQMIAQITSVAGGGGGTTTLDLSAAMTNVLGNAAATLARIKRIKITLLSVAQDSVNGTACSSVTVGNAATFQWITQAHSGGFGSAASVWDITNGATLEYTTGNGPGIAVDGTHKSLLFTNNDSVAAALRIEFIGADA